MSPAERTGPGIGFRVGRTPVRIEWSFLAIVAAFGLYLGHDVASLTTWVVVVVVGVLVHEGGHVLALAAVGRRSRVRLAWLAGMTIGEDDDQPLAPLPSIAVSLAGPAAAVALGLGVEAALRGAEDGWLEVLRQQSLVVNLVWSAFNLLPAVPLDGGHVTRELFELAGRRRAGVVVALAVVATGLGVGAWAVARGWRGGWAVLLLAGLLATNVAFLPLTARQRARAAVGSAHRQLMAGELRSGTAHMQALLASPHAELVGPGPRTSLAWALLHQGRWSDLDRLDLRRTHPAHYHWLQGAVEWYRGDVHAAAQRVSHALGDGSVDPPATYFGRTFGRLGELDLLGRSIQQLPRDQVPRAQRRLLGALAAADRSAALSG